MPRPLEDGCLPEDSRGDSTTLTLSVHRRVEAVKTLLGKRMVRVTLAKSVIDFVVSSAAAQEFWLKELQRQDAASPPLSPTSSAGGSLPSTPRPSVTNVRGSIVHGLLARRDQEVASYQRSSSTPATMTTMTATSRPSSSTGPTPTISPASEDGKHSAFFRKAQRHALIGGRSTEL